MTAQQVKLQQDAFEAGWAAHAAYLLNHVKVYRFNG